MLLTKFQVSWPFGSEEVKKRFSWMVAILDFQLELYFSYFLSTSHPDASYQVLSQLAQGFRRSRLLKQIVDATRGTTDIDRSL